MGDRLTEYEERRRLEAKRRRARTRSRLGNRPEVHDAPCRVCGRRPVEAHHLVPRSKFARGDDAVHDPANLIALCHRCHQDHHTRVRLVPREVLAPAEVEFVVGRMGDRWAGTWYP